MRVFKVSQGFSGVFKILLIFPGFSLGFSRKWNFCFIKQQTANTLFLKKDLVKFRPCEKATKFEKQSHLIRHSVIVETSWRFFQIFVPFSENLNFSRLYYNLISVACQRLVLYAWRSKPFILSLRHQVVRNSLCTPTWNFEITNKKLNKKTIVIFITNGKNWIVL